MRSDYIYLFQSIYGNLILFLIISKLYGQKAKIFDIDFLCGFSIATATVFFSNVIEIPAINDLKFIIIFLSFFISNKIIFGKSNKETIISTLITNVSFLILEIAMAFIILSMSIDVTEEIRIVSNIIIPISSLLITGKTNVVKNFYKKMIRYTKCISFRKILIMVIILLFIFAGPYLFIVFKSHFFEALICLIVIFILLVGILISNLKVNNDLQDTKEKYENSIKNLIQYEEMIDRYRVVNHENKNQLLIIRNMIKRKEKGIENFIDNTVNNRIKDNDELMMKISAIPSGGLRATIYTKLLEIGNKGIEYTLDINGAIRSIELDINDGLMLGICKIMSVFLDNAIEEVEVDPAGYITIDIMYEDNKLIISIGNPYQSKFDITKMEEQGYTTKSTGHGYGLTLVKEIIEREEKLENEKFISSDFFTQTLIIDIKK